ncbi:hypothetical protein RI367_006110 [Sorochytrium milnesiophthora]
MFARATRATTRHWSLRRSLNASAFDSVVVGAYQAGNGSEAFQLTETAKALTATAKDKQHLSRALSARNFKAKPGDVCVLYGVDGLPARVAIVGLGTAEKHASEKKRVNAVAEQARKGAATGLRALRGSGATKIGLEAFGSEHGAAEGATLASYTFDHLKSNPEVAAQKDSTDVQLLDNVAPSAADQTTVSDLSFKTGVMYGQAQNLARTLMEMPANLMTPSIFVETALQEFSKVKNVRIEVRDEKWVKENKMHAFHSVAKGSKEPLKFLEIHYTGAAADDTPPIVLVGKGVCFDSGGISIKPSANMGMMKGDMGGAATVVSAVHGAARLSLPINVTVLVPLCENMPAGNALKPGDVIRAMNGKSIEVDNTDAEGRLILADAIYYGMSTIKPKVLIDVATLTGAMDVALGSCYAGVFTNSDSLWKQLYRSSLHTHDLFWRMPLDSAYLPQMKSAVADIRNSGNRSAGACTAAIFLREFLTPAGKSLSNEEGLGVDYAHIDIAGVMHSESAQGYEVKGMTGRPTRALIEYLRRASQTSNNSL